MACCGCFGKKKPKDSDVVDKPTLINAKSPSKDKLAVDPEPIKMQPMNGNAATMNGQPESEKKLATSTQEPPPQAVDEPPALPKTAPPVQNAAETPLMLPVEEHHSKASPKKLDIEAARKEFFEEMYSPSGGSCTSEKHVCFGKHDQFDLCDLPMCFQKLAEQKEALQRLQKKELLEGLTPEEEEEVARMTSELKCLVDRLEGVANRLEKLAPGLVSTHSAPSGGGSSPAPVSSSPVVQAYGNIVSGPVHTFCELSKKLQGDVVALSDMVRQVFLAQQDFVSLASRCKQPSQDKLVEILKPQSELIMKIQEYRETNRKSSQFNHLSAISESIPALGWVAVSPTPGPHVKEMNDAGQFYTNRVLKEWKEKDKTHAEWVRAWLDCLTELQGYIKQYHTTGLVWNPSGSEATAPAAGAPPPPPPPGPPPPPPPAMLTQPAGGGAEDDRAALFAAINRGSDITKGLKKVTADMQTHKNPTLREGPAPFKATSPTKSSQSSTKTEVSKPPSFVLDGKKWLVEYQKDAPSLVISETSMNQVVYMFKCENTTLQVKGKVNSIIMDSCKKSAVVFDSVVASMEFVNCQKVQMQVMGTVATISIDKSDGVQMYLSDDSLNVELVSSKSSEMNVMVPKDGDMVEYPLPEQYKTTIGSSGLTTSCLESL